MTGFGTQNEHRREEWIRKTIEQLPGGLRILDAGAGEQGHKKLCQHLEYVSQDFAEYDGQGDSRGLQMGQWNYSKLDIISDITRIPEPNSSFDAILCSEVFEHIPKPIEALKEFHRLLKTDGILILTAPFCSLTHFSPYHYYSGYNRGFYEMILPEIGFEITEILSNGSFFEYLAQEILRLPQIASKYSGVKMGRLYRLAAAHVLRCLSKCSSTDKASDEILCFGYHVRASKK